METLIKFYAAEAQVQWTTGPGPDSASRSVSTRCADDTITRKEYEASMRRYVAVFLPESVVAISGGAPW